jgi:hypothetical protein
MPNARACRRDRHAWREGEIWTLVWLALAIQSIVLIPVQGFGMLGEDVEEDLSHILSANV